MSGHKCREADRHTKIGLASIVASSYVDAFAKTTHEQSQSQQRMRDSSDTREYFCCEVFK